MRTIYKLTTIDNPYSPFTHPDEWHSYDLHYHGDMCNRLVASFNDIYDKNLTDGERIDANNDAIQRILDFDPIGIFIRVTKDSNIRPIPLNVLLDSTNDIQ